ncbi:Myb-like DNA-binding domain containing protein [Trichomonas vaginalis G3]|uniref:Myb-like DNA-binding domain containing protein n=1 Tax=Trichomonas vaginalis (strain ATCC PRA-98 / G3) TaxID=412133 RepID=A2DX02_TRIV3|nr:RNA polymerase II transcription regulator recruiting protein [Trichomonas vaginalis G3]EAY15029.1 Myb-like DNA-binding domain containing protein [Trichomonas vaginalis G3]KAI5549570.1 RNA polymerase II transcription regulator recruiting protein [Trichomonas vaginalis G3]|eukprot:XP_001327252.1 Myb-like DNA-binding domain containing protein [Trichomonas vaginalis G3]
MGNRNPRQCRDRYTKYLSPDLNKNPWTPEEDALLISKYHEIGAKWVKMSKFFNNRTDYSLKNRWNVLVRHNSVTMNSPISEPEEEKIIDNQSEIETAVQDVTADPMFMDFDFTTDFDLF